MRNLVLSALAGLLLALPAAAQTTPPKVITTADGKKYFTGRVIRNPVAHKAMFQANVAQHQRRLKALPRVAAASFDCRSLGLVGPVQDQGQCGSCWDFSGCAVATFAMYKTGQLKNDGTGSNYLSQQCVLDCGRNGGCNGDDNTTVLDMCKSQGLPVQADYGPYTASTGRCKQVAKVYKLRDWGFCDGQSYDRVSDTQKIKDCMAQYGPIGCAVAAGGDNFWNTGEGTGTANSNQIDHDVTLVGWDDNHDNGDGSKGAWIMLNSWGAGWGSGCGVPGSGCAWVKYGAYSLGTEAVWALAEPGPGPPPPPPPPVPPDPPGPVPPGPTPSTVSITLTVEQVQSVISQSGAVVISGDMPLSEAIKALQGLQKSLVPLPRHQETPKAGCPCKPKELPQEPVPAPANGRLDALERDVQEMKRGMDAVIKLLLKQQKTSHGRLPHDETRTDRSGATGGCWQPVRRRELPGPGEAAGANRCCPARPSV